MSASSTTGNLEQVVSTVSNVDLSIMALILSADLVGKLVIIILVVASIWSWGIIINKLIYSVGVSSEMSGFVTLFWSGTVLDDLYEQVKKSIDKPLYSVIVNAFKEC